MEPRLTAVPSGWAAPRLSAPPPQCSALPSPAPMLDAIIRRCLASGPTMDGGRSGLRLMFPWERVLPMPCPTSRALLGNATWAKEAPVPSPLESSVQVTQHNTWPQGRQDCFSKVTLPARDLGSPKLGPKADEPSLTCPHQATLPSPGLSPWYPRNYRMGNLPPRLPSIPGLWRHSVPTGQQAGPEYIRHMQY